MNSLKIGISGVRGVVGESFTPELAVAFAQAFGTYLDAGRILVCRDTRASGPMVHAAVLSGLLAAGCEVVDLGVCPTPSLQLAAPWLGAEGGISITAGHNPEPWNALKFVRRDGLYLNAAQADELLDIFHQGEFSKAAWQHIRSGVAREDAVSHHLGVLSRAFDVDAIRARRLRVAVDCCNSSCSLLSPRWLGALGCEVLAVNDDPEAPFPHAPEPNRQTMAQLRAVVLAGRADIGFAHDADGERVGVVAERGEILSEEATLVLAARYVLGRERGPVVANLSSTQALDAVARAFGCPVYRSKIGEANVTEEMARRGAVVGGEGNGGVIYPRINFARDSLVGMALVLHLLAETGRTVSELLAELPRPFMVKEKIACRSDRIRAALAAVRDAYAPLPMDLRDGVKVTTPDGWFLVRGSNTEPIIRVVAEAETEARARTLAEEVTARVRARLGRENNS